MGRNLTNLYISSSFQFLTQVSGSELQDGLGNKITGSLDITSSKADNATSASYASTSVSSSYSTTALSSSYAATATSSSVAINATSASYATSALSSSYALTASYAANAGTTVDTGSLMKTGSVNLNTLTFTKGDGSTFNLTVDTGSAGSTFPFTGSAIISGSLTVTGSLNVSSNITGSNLRVENNTHLDGQLRVTNDATFDTHILVQGTQPHVKLRDTSGGGFSSGYDIRVNTGSFEIYDDTHNRNVLSDIFNTGSAKHTTILSSEVVIISGSDSVTVQGPLTASLFGTASYATQALSASFATNAETASNTPNAVITASVNLNTITFTKGDASTFNVTVNTGSAAAAFPFTGSAQITGSLGITGSISQNLGLKTQINTGTTTLNTTAGQFQTVIGTESGSVATNYSTAVGTRFPFVNGVYASTLGGNILSASANWASAIGGESNRASGVYASVIGGNTNIAAGNGAFVAGGFSNNVTAGALQSAIIAGESNTISNGTDCAIVGSFGSSITAASYAYGIYGALGSTITQAAGYSATIFGGSDNVINSTDGNGNRSILSGQGNQIKGGSWNGVVLGQGNIVSGSSSRSVIVGGLNNLILNATSSVILGGSRITASADNTVYVPNLDISGSSTFRNNAVFSGSVRGEVRTLTISSNTASLDCSLDNFFTLTLVSGSTTYINPTNIQPGQTINLLVNPTGSGLVAFPSTVKQVSGSAYMPTTGSGTLGKDIITFISFDSTDLYLSNVKNLV
jgi:hypothetical protein